MMMMMLMMMMMMNFLVEQQTIKTFFQHKQLFADVFKVIVLKSFAIFTTKHLYLSLFLATLLKRDSNTVVLLLILRNL